MRTNKELIELVNKVGQLKADRGSKNLFILSLLAGFYIAFGAIFFTVVTSYGGNAAFIKVLGGVSFSLGLILVVLGGAELFTGNNLMVISMLNKKISFSKLLRNWSIVYIGNLIGSLIIVGLMFATDYYLQDNSVIGIKALGIAHKKVNLSFTASLSKAILCNTLVCLAVWLTMVAKTTSGKILSILFPISAFVAIGFEHSIANMYFIPMGLLLKSFAPESFWIQSQLMASDFSSLNFSGFMNNIIPVSLGNIIGGVVFVALTYWYVNKNESN